MVGIDCFTDYYERARKERNLRESCSNEKFELLELDLVDGDLRAALEGASIVFHLAAQPGVRPSWGRHFETYVRDNIVATQKLLEALKETEVQRVVYASSSSVYGDAEAFPTKEDALPKPVSPYGMTKLAAEHLALLYMRNFGIPVTSVRYFTVYGPRQRPDMAFSRFIKAMMEGREIEVYGDGEQTREFTFVADAVDGTLRAAKADVAGMVVNLGGGTSVTVNGVLSTLEEISGTRVRRREMAAAPGDPRHTGASIELARERLGWTPRVPLREGLQREWDWYSDVLAREGATEAG